MYQMVFVGEVEDDGDDEEEGEEVIECRHIPPEETMI